MKTPLPPVFQLEVSLRHIEPRIWRRLLVPGDATLAELHAIIQIAFGWNNSHLHEFRLGEARYGMASPEDPELLDEKAYRLADLLAAKLRCEYEYDFGDGWEHDVVVEEVAAADHRVRVSCLEGARAAPPDDCGGPLRYGEIVRALRKPRSKAAREFIEWYGEGFDPEAFDLDEINRSLR